MIERGSPGKLFIVTVFENRSGRILKEGDSLVKPGLAFSREQSIGLLLPGVRTHIANQLSHSLALIANGLSADKIHCLNAIGALVDGKDPGISIVLCNTRFLDEPHATMALYGQRCYFLGDFRAPAFHQRSQKISTAFEAVTDIVG